MSCQRGTVVVEATILELIIKKNKDEIPVQLIGPVDKISTILLNIESLKDKDKEGFKRLVGKGSVLAVVLFHSYQVENPQHRAIWPSPQLRRVIDTLIKTLHSATKLLAGKREEVFLKRMIFSIRDIGKVEKYLRKLDSAIAAMENERFSRVVLNINAALLELVSGELQDEEAGPTEAEVEGDADINEGTKNITSKQGPPRGR